MRWPESFRAVRHSRIRSGISISFFVRRIPVTVTTREPITPNTGTGPKPLLTRLLGHCAPPECRGQQLQSEQSVLTALKASLQSTNGQQQALQALGDVSEHQVEQLMKLRELMMADMSSKQAYQAAMIQQHAASEAAAQRFFMYSPASSDGQKFGPGWN